MMIRVMRKLGSPPENEGDGALVWLGGEDAAEETSLAASVLTGMAPIEVGTWYPYNDFQTRLTQLKFAGAETWTTVELKQVGVDGAFSARVEILEEEAIRLICEGTVRHCSRLGDHNSLWVRIE